MSKSMLAWLPSLLSRFGSRTLVILMGALFVADLVIMDPIPFVDEILLGVATLLLARWQSRRDDKPIKPPPKNVTPESER